MADKLCGVNWRFRWYVLIVAVILSLALSIGFQAASAQRGGSSPPPAALDYLCVNSYTDMLRDVASPACQPHETLLTLPDDYPFLACANNHTKFLRYAGDAECRSYETPVPMPPEANSTLLCLMPPGMLRLIPNPNQCPAAGTLAEVVPPPSPLADHYDALGNVPIEVPATSGLLANDPATSGTISAFDATSANGGTVTVSSDGGFSYAPPAAFRGTDTFTYTVTNSSGSATGTVEIAITGAVWFVDGAQPGNGEGTQSSPFNTLAAVNTDGTDPDEQGDIIYLFSSATAYGGGIVLEDDQAIISQVIDPAELSTIPPFSVMPPVNPGGARPTVTNATGDGVTLAPGTFVAGLTVNDTGGSGVGGAGFTGDVTLDRVAVSSPGNGNPAMELSAIEGTVTLTASQVTGRNNTDPGGTGLAATDVTHVTIEDGSVVSGGSGSLFTVIQGGVGIVSAGSDITIDAATVAGGDAGLPPFVDGMHGGNAIEFTDSTLTVRNGSTVVAGDAAGGSSTGGSGGAALIGDHSTVTIDGSTVTGGTGGPGTTTQGGAGGPGASVTDGTLTATGSTIKGGNGSASLGNSGAGAAGVEAQNSAVTIEGNTTITGGNGGIGAIGDPGSGGSGIVGSDGTLLLSSVTVVSGNGGTDALSAGSPGFSILVDDTDLTITTSTLSLGTGSTSNAQLIVITNDGGTDPVAATLTDTMLLVSEATVPSLLVQTNSATSSICLNASGNSNGEGGAPVGPFVLDNNAGTLGITQADELTLSADNFNVEVQVEGVISFSCMQD